MTRSQCSLGSLGIISIQFATRMKKNSATAIITTVRLTRPKVSSTWFCA